MVELSTGIDFVRAVIETALGQRPALQKQHPGDVAAVRFVFTQEDAAVLAALQEQHPEYLVAAEVEPVGSREVTDSGSRFGYYLMMAETAETLVPYLPAE